jgi:hypothetical protein
MAVYFASQWPLATIVAVEPDPSNFSMLVSNTQGLPIQALNAAAGKDGWVRLTDPGVGLVGLRTRSCEYAIAARRREISGRCGTGRRTNDSRGRSAGQRDCSSLLRHVVFTQRKTNAVAEGTPRAVKSL